MNREVIGMTKANEVMDVFMKRLAADEYKKDNQPNNGPKLSSEFIEKQVKSYSKLLKTGIVDIALKRK